MMLKSILLFLLFLLSSSLLNASAFIENLTELFKAPSPMYGIEVLKNMEHINFDDLHHVCITEPFPTLVYYMLPYMPESEMSKAGDLVDELDKKLDSEEGYRLDETIRIITYLQENGSVKFNATHLFKIIQKNQSFPACKLISAGVVPDDLCVSAAAQLKQIDVVATALSQYKHLEISPMDFGALVSDLTDMRMNDCYQLIQQCLFRKMDLTCIMFDDDNLLEHFAKALIILIRRRDPYYVESTRKICLALSLFTNLEYSEETRQDLYSLQPSHFKALEELEEISLKFMIFKGMPLEAIHEDIIKLILTMFIEIVNVNHL